MLNFVFVIVMLGFILFATIFITVTIFYIFNAVLERVAGVGIFDIVDYAISAILNGIRAFLE